ncbi:LCP family protein [bacterium]|nr:LCP family protein [bacterium]
MSDSGHNAESTESTGNARTKGKGSFRRFLGFMGRFLFWSAVVITAWWFVSSTIHSIPGPGDVLRETLYLAKDVTDGMYQWAEEEHLEEVADRVRSAAVEQPRSDTLVSDAERLTDERRARLPVRPIEGDSALHAQLQRLSRRPPVGGRLINILIIGIDSRLSARDARADALHLVSINPDSAVVEIMSIPRDTYSDLGYPDTTTFNIIANAKTTDNQRLLRKVAKIAQRGPVNYFVEVGFSQAMGIMEILGYRDPVSTLQFLRTRRTLPGGDIQRAHNQALFMRQNLIGKFPLLTGATGDMIITAGLNFLTTNLTKDFCLGLVYNLKKRGFPQHREDAVRLRMPPGNNIRLKEMVADSSTIHNTLARVERRLGSNGDSPNVAAYLRRVYTRAMRDSTHPGKIVYRLRRLNEQHAWLQIQDEQSRIGIRDTLTSLLEFAYRKLGQTANADAVRSAREAEDLLIQRGVLRQQP